VSAHRDRLRHAVAEVLDDNPAGPMTAAGQVIDRLSEMSSSLQGWLDERREVIGEPRPAEGRLLEAIRVRWGIHAAYVVLDLLSAEPELVTDWLAEREP
jgi:hypothetical protein